MNPLSMNANIVNTIVETESSQYRALDYDTKYCSKEVRDTAYLVGSLVLQGIREQEGASNPKIHISATGGLVDGSNKTLVITASANGQSIIDNVDVNSIKDNLPIGTSVVQANGNITIILPK